MELPTAKELLSSLKYHLNTSEVARNHDFVGKHEKELADLAEEMYKQKYSQRDVQKLAEDTVKRVREQLSKSKDYASEEIHMEYLKDAMKNKGIVTGNLGENTGSSITDREADIINLLRSLTGIR